MNITVFEDIRKEFKVNADGITHTSKRGVGRLCDVPSENWFRKNKPYLFNKKLDEYIVKKLNLSDVQNKDELLKTLIEKEFVRVSKNQYEFVDIFADVIIKFYAYKAGSDCTEQAEMVQDLMGAVGLRVLVQKTLGWSQQPKSYEDHILTEPRKWTKVFGDDFYDELARLTGLTWDKKTHRKPHKFAQCTDELIYDHLPDDFKAKLKETSSKHGYNMYKLHQFFDPKSLEFLKNHLQKVIHIMSGETSYETAKLKIAQSITKNYQHNLFG